MTYPHAIRLGEPWQRVAQGDSVRYQRSFHCPTGLDTLESVWLVLENAPAAATIFLNERVLGEFSSQGGFFESNITALLAPRNTIRIDVQAVAAQATSEVLGLVRLEIRSESAAS